ncbi:MAG: LysR family transcriptional regulator [Janthinobacterium lividum]
MDTFTSLKTLLQVVQCGNFSEAARRAGISPSAALKRINFVEWRLRVRLLDRSTRHVRLTDDGHRMLEPIRAIVSDLDELIDEMTASSDRLEGRIRIKAPTALSTFLLAGLLSEFQLAHEGVSMDVVLMDRAVNPLEEGFDMVVDAFIDSFPGVLDIPLFPLRRIVCAAPGYLARHGTPAHPRDLLEHTCLAFASSGVNWLFESAHGPLSVVVTPRFTSNDATAIARAAASGMGIALLADFMVTPALKAGELVRVLDAYPTQNVWVKASIPEHRVDVPRIDALVRWLRDRLAPAPLIPSHPVSDTAAISAAPPAERRQ